MVDLKIHPNVGNTILDAFPQSPMETRLENIEDQINKIGHVLLDILKAIEFNTKVNQLVLEELRFIPSDIINQPEATSGQGGSGTTSKGK